MDDTDFTEVKTWFGTDYIGALRHLRNILLRESDWTQFTDSPLTDSKKTEWKTYRQSLRDMTKQTPKLDSRFELDLTSVTWPTEPT